MSILEKVTYPIQRLPFEAHGVNLRLVMSVYKRNKLFKKIKAQKNHTCERCGTFTEKAHCHEKWDIDLNNNTQAFIGFEVLCQMCHCIDHEGFTFTVMIPKYFSAADYYEHFRKINGLTQTELEEYLAERHKLREQEECDYIKRQLRHPLFTGEKETEPRIWTLQLPDDIFALIDKTEVIEREGSPFERKIVVEKL